MYNDIGSFDTDDDIDNGDFFQNLLDNKIKFDLDLDITDENNN